MAFIVLAHVEGLDLQKLVDSASELRRLNVLLHQSLRVSRATSVDEKSLGEAAKLVNSLYP